jgi:metal-responsive CopG/Arc/MetJ family transcriptional regulator
MSSTRTRKVTISLPHDLLEFADTIAAETGETRSGVLADLLAEKQRQQLHALMAEGYREFAKENLAQAEEALNITDPVEPSDG